MAGRLLAERISLLAPLPGQSDVRLFELLDALAADYELQRRRSVRRLRVSITHLKAFFADPLARDVDPTSIVAYATARTKAGAGPGTVDVELAALRRAFRLAKQLGRIANVPTVHMLVPPPPRAGFVEAAVLAAILEHLPTSVRPVVQVAAVTGWRLQHELLTRRWSHLDLKGGWLRLEPGEGKAGDARNFPLTAALRAVLEAQRQRADEFNPQPTHVFFDHVTGARLKSIRLAWHAAVQAAGCPHLRPHDLRRTAVRNLERAGVPRSSAQKLVGHKTESMYSRYAIQDSVMLREAAAKLEAFG